MTDYDDLFDGASSRESVFADKSALDPLGEPEEIVAREAQEQRLADILSGIDEGYLPNSIQVHGPPGTGKTLTVRRVLEAFADRENDLAVEYVNLKTCRSIFSVANEIHRQLTGTKKQAFAGLDGVFEGIWDTLDTYPEWTVLILDEIDHIQFDTNYDPSDFFYRLLRGERKQARGINLTAVFISNQLLEMDLSLDSRVQSAMSQETVDFPLYTQAELRALLAPRLERAFRSDAMTEDVIDHGTSIAAARWGDARKALRLFRRAGETANERGLSRVTTECLSANVAETEKEETIRKLGDLPINHVQVLWEVCWGVRGEQHSVTTAYIVNNLDAADVKPDYQVGPRAVRNLIVDLETMGLVETWAESVSRGGREKRIRPTFDPVWIDEARDRYESEWSADIRSITT